MKYTWKASLAQQGDSSYSISILLLCALPCTVKKNLPAQWAFYIGHNNRLPTKQEMNSVPYLLSK